LLLGEKVVDGKRRNNLRLCAASKELMSYNSDDNKSSIRLLIMKENSFGDREGRLRQSDVVEGLEGPSSFFCCVVEA